MRGSGFVVVLVLLLAAGCASSHRVALTAPQQPRLPTHSQLDAKFNKAVAEVWPMLDKTGRREFASGQRAWNRYVSEECNVAGREFLGGSERPVAVEACIDGLTATRVRDVMGTFAEYCQGKVRTGIFRRCPRQ